MKTSEFDYELPPARIAQTPAEPRDAARLLVIDRRATGQLHHRHFRDLPEYLRPGDVLICNDSRVIPARLFGRKVPGGGRVEVFLLRRRDDRTWEALVRGRARVGTRIVLAREGPLSALSPPGRGEGEGRPHSSDRPVAECLVVAELDSGGRFVEFDRPIEPLWAELGHVPLPPYIHTPLADPERYQTVYARVQGSVAAPTAGLHFTPELIEGVQALGVEFAFVTLHIGLDTFRPVQVDEIETHPMHAEWASLAPETAAQLNRAHARGGRLFAVGTTAVRVLETAASRSAGEDLSAYEGWTRLYITPGYRFRAVDALVTNFHLPRSTLLMLVSAFAGVDLIRRAYQEAMATGYRFYSFGDATLIV
ncbi:MAG: tRNA preQ1(34) S-adenosylmethionine ribosyltransferase-isomerase QueA [Anaerolineae bacterium]|nr:tRNA preQ1(34) S-adenosylmethionine ribosyltransferase-isomerase QueA [Anaerolineae bacterium]